MSTATIDLFIYSELLLVEVVLQAVPNCKVIVFYCSYVGDVSYLQ